MPSTLYDKGRQAFSEGQVNWLSDTIRAALVDLNDYALTVSAVTLTNPAKVTTSVAHGLTTGDRVVVTRAIGPTIVNDKWFVTVVDTTNFTLDGCDSSGASAYVSGGFVVKVSRDQWLTDIPAVGRVAIATLASKTNVNGVLGCAAIVWTSVVGDTCEAIVVYRRGGTDGASALLAFIDDAANLPITPNGSNITLNISGSNKLFRL